MHASGFSRFRLTSAVFVLTVLWGQAGFAAGTLELASRVDPGALSDTGSGTGIILPYPPAVSRDGRYVAFLSVANNLVPGQIDLNTSFDQTSSDLFLYDRVTRTVTLVSHAAGSPVTTGDDESFDPAISADGRWVLYRSTADNLVDGIPEFSRQSRLYLWDRISGSTTLVSPPPGHESNCSGNGCGVRGAAISADGRWVAFLSNAPDLVPGQSDTFANLFLYDRTSRQTVVVSSDSTAVGLQSFSLSADGRYVAFDTVAFNPEGPEPGTGTVYLYDRVAAAVSQVGPGSHPTISADGGSIAFLSGSSRVIPGQIDPNGSGLDVFLYSRATRTAVLASHAVGKPTTTGNAASDSGPYLALPAPLLSADGRYVTFYSRATNLVQGQSRVSGPALFSYDRGSGAVILVSRAHDSPVKLSANPGSPSMSADGRLIVFDSRLSDLVPGEREGNYGPDVFLFDRKSGKTVLVSAQSRSSLTTANGGSANATISADGSQIAFQSTATDLVTGVRDLNSSDDLFVYDVSQRAANLATLHAPGMASRGPDADSFVRGLSADGRWVLFEGSAANLAPGQIDLNGQSDVFLYDHTAKTVTLVSHAGGSAVTAGDGPSLESTLSADGRFVAFASDATNLDPTVSDYSDPRTGQRRRDVFLFDRVTGKITALSRSARHPGLTGDDDSQIPVISADGRWVAFRSFATDLTPATDTATGTVYLYDRVAGVLKRTNASVIVIGAAKPLSISADGRYLAVLSSDTHGPEIYLYDRGAGTQTLVSHAPDGTGASVPQDETPALSADGRFVAFTSGRSDLGGTPGGEVSIYLWDRTIGAITLAGVSDLPGHGYSLRHPVLSADGRWLAFLSNRSLVPGADNPGNADQVYLYDRTTGSLTLVGSPAGTLAISADGRYVVNGLNLYDRITGTTTVLGTAGVGDLFLSADGHSVAFQTRTPNLVPGDFNGARSDVFLLSGVTP